MAVLRCERLASGDVDAAIAGLGEATLARKPDGSFIEIEDALAERTTRVLAFAGIRATAAHETLAPVAGMRAAVGRDLTPLERGSLALDLVHVRALPLGRESARLLAAPPWRRPGRARRNTVRELLRGTNAAIAWRRRAWTTRAVLRTAEARRALRPVVFDIAALRAPPEHRALSADGSLARWLFA
jgi:hypothetical protein